MKSIIKLTVVLLAIVALLTQGTVIFISNTSAADSINATNITLKIQKLSEENINLQSKILTLASYDIIASRAAELGYKNTRDFVSVYTPLPVAFGR